MTEDFYTPEQLVAMVRFTNHSTCRGKSVYADSSSLLRAFRFACDWYEALHGDDSLREEHAQSVKRRGFSRVFIDRIFPYTPGVKNSKGLPMKFVDYEISAPAPATEISTVPPIDPAYIARVVHAAAQQRLKRARPFNRIRHVEQLEALKTELQRLYANDRR